MDGLLANPQPQPQPGFWRGLLDAFGQDAAAARDWFISNMQRASGGGILNEGETDTGARAGAGMSLAGAAMTGAMPGGVFAAPRGAALGAGPIRAYHGSPHDFDRFDLSKIGTGEGAQAYGHGLYFAENEGVARSYRDNLAKSTVDFGGKRMMPAELSETLWRESSGNIPDPIRASPPFLQGIMDAVHEFTATGKRPVAPDDLSNWLGYGPLSQRQGYALAAKRLAEAKGTPGRMYEVAIHADPERFLDWDKPLKAQPGLLKAVRDDGFAAADNAKRTGGDFYRAVMDDYGADPDQISLSLRDIGIPGIRYLDAGSRGAGDGSRNYVVFSDAIIEILRKYGLLAPTVAAGGGLLATQDSQAAPR